MKYCVLEVFRKEYFMLDTSGYNTYRKTALISFKKKLENVGMNSRYISMTQGKFKPF